MIKKKPLQKALPLIIVVALGSLFFLMLFFSRKAPVIYDKGPILGSPGQTILLQGKYFGYQAKEGQLSIAGRMPPPSAIQSWNDKEIVFVVPEDAVSGLITVTNSQGTSQGVLFTNLKQVPSFSIGRETLKGQPVIYAIEPELSIGGQVIKLRGDFFGENASNSCIQFTGTRPLVLKFYSLESWSDHEISLRLPPGLASETGFRVSTPRGLSPTFPLLLQTPWKKSQSITYTLKLTGEFTSNGANGHLTLWAVLPPEEETLRSHIRTSVPLLPGHWDVALPLRWKNPLKGKHEFEILLDVTTFSWETHENWTVLEDKGAPHLVEVPWKGDDKILEEHLVRWGAQKADALTRSQKIYDALVQSIAASDEKFAIDAKSFRPQQVLENKKATAPQMAFLYVSLCQAATLTARPVVGFLAHDKSQLVGHAWAEVWLPPAGWVPVDPYLGIKDPKAHFARMTNDHIPWAFLPVQGPRIDPDSQLLTGSPFFLFQNAQGETTGDLEISEIKWNVPEVITTKNTSF